MKLRPAPALTGYGRNLGKSNAKSIYLSAKVCELAGGGVVEH
jgi:hypothetical protein